MSTQTLPPIPAGSLLIHVGMPKSATTAVQRAAAGKRPELLDQGVLYPGQRINHSHASFALSKRPRGWSSGDKAAAVPGRKHWDKLASEIRSAACDRVFISHEFFAELPAATVERMVAEAGRPAHVVFTLRNQASVLRSAWQQRLKSGVRKNIDEWSREVLADPDGPNASLFAQRTNLAMQVEKWASVVGSDNVTLIVLDPGDRLRVFRAFEQMLGLRENTLGEMELSGRDHNRSMTLPEAELIRALNREVMKEEDLRWDSFIEVHRKRVVHAILGNRVPAPDEPRIGVPAWAMDVMIARAARQVAEIKGMSVRVVGDLDALARPLVARGPVAQSAQVIPIDVATAALAPLVIHEMQDLDRRSESGPAEQADEFARAAAEPPLERVSNRALLREVTRRARRTLRRRRG
ncbi:hypothetical protein [Rarobacter incanus]|uniref:Sulfotransferase family protein n=1 Tax=Rarobacter incanus TaxID=153494 RepID=A0A542SNE5_9MICO|nr:hypothetical protein [Rarobacter incanus]TQK76045.1 hypothetical protein FB389_0700 [Rarobacter incanus]